MCLYIGKAPDRFQRKYYKVFRRHDSKALGSIYYKEEDRIESPGMYVSDREKSELSSFETRRCVVDHGIHVFLDRKTASKFCAHLNQVVVEVWGKKEDLVAYGTSHYTQRQTDEAVFMKVKITKKEWRKVMG